MELTVALRCEADPNLWAVGSEAGSCLCRSLLLGGFWKDPFFPEVPLVPWGLGLSDQRPHRSATTKNQDLGDPCGPSRGGGPEEPER